MQVSDEIMFEKLVTEIRQIDDYVSAIDIMHALLFGDLDRVCRLYFFREDDGKIDEQEQKLLDWIPTMKDKEEAIKKLLPVAYKLSKRP